MARVLVFKQILLILLILSPLPSLAKSKFWISNKLEMGYENVFISEQITFSRNGFIKNDLAIGLKFKISGNASFKTFCLLENAIKYNWKNDYFLGVKLNLKLQ